MPNQSIAPRSSTRRTNDRRKMQADNLPFPDRRTGQDRRSGLDRRLDSDRNSLD